MRSAFITITSIMIFGLLCASCFAGWENERLAQLGAAECQTFDCWE